MLAKLCITVLLILIVVTTYTQTHNTIIYSRHKPNLLKYSITPKAAFAKTQKINPAALDTNSQLI